MIEQLLNIFIQLKDKTNSDLIISGLRKLYTK